MSEPFYDLLAFFVSAPLSFEESHKAKKGDTWGQLMKLACNPGTWERTQKGPFVHLFSNCQKIPFHSWERRSAFFPSLQANLNLARLRFFPRKNIGPTRSVWDSRVETFLVNEGAGGAKNWIKSKSCKDFNLDETFLISKRYLGCCVPRHTRMPQCAY